MILNVEEFNNDDVILCVDCHDKIIDDIIDGIKNSKPIPTIDVN